MGLNKPNGIEQTKSKSNGIYNSALGSILYMSLPENVKTTGLAIVVHHGETDGNLGKNAMDGKSKMEPLNQKGKEEISEIAEILKEKIPEGDIGRVRIHVNDEVLRNKQTAEIIEKILGVNPAQIIFSEDLRSQDKVYDENHKLIRQEYFSSSDHEGKSESIPKLRSMAADYVASTIENNPDLIHIFVTNRVSYKGFENWADKDLDAIHDYKLKTGIMRIVPVNKDGKPLNYVNSSLPVSEQENQIKSELSTLASELNIQDIDEFSDNLFDKNNRLRLRFLDFCKIGIEKGYSNIMTSLFTKYPNLLEKTIKTLLPEIHDEKGKEFIDTIVLGYLENIGISKDNGKLSLSLLNALHENNGNWKYLFRKLYSYDTEILLQDTIMKNDDVLSYYETLQKQSENNKEYQSNIVPIFLGEVEWDKFFIPVTMEKNGEIVSIDKLIQDILNTSENAFYIQGGAGSGKTILTKYLAKELGKVGNNWIKMIDLNTIEKFTSEELTKNIPSDFDGNKIIIFDGLDEKNMSKLEQLMNYLQYTKSGSIKYICSSRFFSSDSDKNSLDENDKLKSKIYCIKDIDSMQSQEIIKKYENNLDKNYKEEFENKVNSILQKIGDTNHSPLVITMVISIVQDYVCNDEYYEILDQDDIKLSDIYDTFVKFLHNRENKKANKSINRTKNGNEFMSQKWNDLRIEFLKYLSLFNGSYGDQSGFYPQGEFIQNIDGDRSYTKGQLRNIFYHWVEYTEYLQSEKGQTKPSFLCPTVEDMQNDYELIYRFIDGLTNYGFLQCDEDKGFYFPHKSFQEYFGYKNLKEFDYEDIKQNVKILLGNKSLGLNYLPPGDTNKNYLSYYNQVKGILLSYGFDDLSKLLKLVIDLKSEIGDIINPDYDPYASQRFESIVEDVLCEYFSNDKDIKYKHLKLIEDILPNQRVWGDLSLFECLKKEFEGNGTIINKLNNMDKFGDDKICDDYQLNDLGIRFYSGNVKALLKELDPGSFICCILFDRDLYFDFEQDL